jgi:hypothetical protein
MKLTLHKRLIIGAMYDSGLFVYSTAALACRIMAFQLFDFCKEGI